MNFKNPTQLHHITQVIQHSSSACVLLCLLSGLK
uniref:Uncharacterized protein n=1 Tax=Anguilla anguilla TaxID=7936 RepID=A0A0E9Q6X1_ANGAN